tara:strand:- start:6163 stop:6807 length:645 start_codon:yes stop_codon:yes gene_type:complete
VQQKTEQCCSALLLGAGLGRRFGTDKRLARLGAASVAEQTARRYAQTFSQLFIVLRQGDESLAEVLSPFAKIVLSERAHQGMGASLADGMQSLMGASACPWAFVGLLDMPFIRQETLDSLQQVALTSSKLIIRPTLSQEIPVPEATPRQGHPVGFHASLFQDLCRSEGDRGAKHLLQARAGAVQDHLLEDLGILADIDRPEDLARWSALLPSSG